MEEQQALTDLELRIRTILPPEYQDRYEDVQPVSMGSAGLKYGDDGKVAWDQMWNTFCDLAMAGGPPHKGTLLRPGSAAEIAAHSKQYKNVVDELCRGINLVSDLEAEASTTPGWIRLECESDCMAEWLVRAIVMENVSARCSGAMLELPAGPHYCLEKEIKNVVTVIAKTCHYWVDHMFLSQQRKIAELFATLSRESPLIQPPRSAGESLNENLNSIGTSMAANIEQQTTLRANLEQLDDGWLGLECSSIRAAIWIMRAIVASNVLSRREGTILFAPVDPSTDPSGNRLVETLAHVHRLARARGVF